MKVGVDAVILGAWADIGEADSILDVGCGCGVISLMCAQRNAQRNAHAKIHAIDIDESSVEESGENFQNSPWSCRLSCELTDFNVFCRRIEEDSHADRKLDYIISNPPYFDSGIENPATARMQARHQDALSPAVILEKGRDMLSAKGKIGMVVPIEQAEELEFRATKVGLYLQRMMIMTGREGKEAKRAFMEFGKQSRKKEIGTLTIECADGSFTPEYISLCKDFYLKF